MAAHKTEPGALLGLVYIEHLVGASEQTIDTPLVLGVGHEERIWVGVAVADELALARSL